MTWLSINEGWFLKSLRGPQHKELLRRLIEGRKRAGLTQQGLAVRLRRHQSFVAKYEGGERRIEVIEFLQICGAIGIEPGRIFRYLLKMR